MKNIEWFYINELEEPPKNVKDLNAFMGVLTTLNRDLGEQFGTSDTPKDIAVKLKNLSTILLGKVATFATSDADVVNLKAQVNQKEDKVFALVETFLNIIIVLPGLPKGYKTDFTQLKLRIAGSGTTETTLKNTRELILRFRDKLILANLQPLSYKGMSAMTLITEYTAQGTGKLTVAYNDLYHKYEEVVTTAERLSLTKGYKFTLTKNISTLKLYTTLLDSINLESLLSANAEKEKKTTKVKPVETEEVVLPKIKVPKTPTEKKKTTPETASAFIPLTQAQKDYKKAQTKRAEIIQKINNAFSTIRLSNDLSLRALSDFPKLQLMFGNEFNALYRNLTTASTNTNISKLLEIGVKKSALTTEEMQNYADRLVETSTIISTILSRIDSSSDLLDVTLELKELLNNIHRIISEINRYMNVRIPEQNNFITSIHADPKIQNKIRMIFMQNALAALGTSEEYTKYAPKLIQLINDTEFSMLFTVSIGYKAPVVLKAHESDYTNLTDKQVLSDKFSKAQSKRIEQTQTVGTLSKVNVKINMDKVAGNIKDYQTIINAVRSVLSYGDKEVSGVMATQYFWDLYLGRKLYDRNDETKINQYSNKITHPVTIYATQDGSKRMYLRTSKPEVNKNMSYSLDRSGRRKHGFGNIYPRRLLYSDILQARLQLMMSNKQAPFWEILENGTQFAEDNLSRESHAPVQKGYLKSALAFQGTNFVKNSEEEIRVFLTTEAHSKIQTLRDISNNGDDAAIIKYGEKLQHVGEEIETIINTMTTQTVVKSVMSSIPANIADILPKLDKSVRFGSEEWMRYYRRLYDLFNILESGSIGSMREFNFFATLAGANNQPRRTQIARIRELQRRLSTIPQEVLTNIYNNVRKLGVESQQIIQTRSKPGRRKK